VKYAAHYDDGSVRVIDPEGYRDLDRRGIRRFEVYGTDTPMSPSVLVPEGARLVVRRRWVCKQGEGDWALAVLVGVESPGREIADVHVWQQDGGGVMYHRRDRYDDSVLFSAPVLEEFETC
jgi:hypothetical protein